MLFFAILFSIESGLLGVVQFDRTVPVSDVDLFLMRVHFVLSIANLYLLLLSPLWAPIPAWIAHRKRRRWYMWALCTVIIGPPALLVHFLAELPAPPTPASARICENCGASYDLSEYRADLPRIFCSSCGEGLPERGASWPSPT